jgi:hypothetical protein
MKMTAGEKWRSDLAEARTRAFGSSDIVSRKQKLEDGRLPAGFKEAVYKYRAALVATSSPDTRQYLPEVIRAMMRDAGVI